VLEAHTGAHIWADKYDGALEDIFDLQDTITASVAAAIEPKLIDAEIERARRKHPDDLTAYDLYLRALPLVYSVEEKGNTEALHLLTAAMQRDPDFAGAYAMAAWCYFIRQGQGWPVWRPEDDALGLTFARKALDLDPNDPTVLWAAGFSLLGARDYERAISFADRSVALNPNSALGWSARGWARVFAGETHRTHEDFERAIRLSPFDTLLYFFYLGIALSRYFQGRYEEALEFARMSVRHNARFTAALRVVTASCGMLGHVDEGRSAVAGILRENPQMSVSYWRTRSAQKQPSLERFLEGLRLAGLPE
jgi:adenylate cyclase